SVRCRDATRTRSMNLRMDREGGCIYQRVAFHDLAVVVDQHQVGNPYLAEVQSERVDPKMVSPLRIARRDMSGYTFVISEFGEKTEGCSQPLFSMHALFFQCGERRRLGKFERIRLGNDYLRFCFMHLDHLNLLEMYRRLSNLRRTRDAHTVVKIKDFCQRF